MVDQQDDEITIDFSKIKNIFKKKTEKDKVHAVEQKAETVKQELNKEINEYSDKEKILKSDLDKVNSIEKDIRSHTPEAEKIDKETQKFENKIRQDNVQLKKIEKDLDSEEEISFDMSKVKNFFKNTFSKSRSGGSSQHRSEDDISFDMKKINQFTKRYSLLILVMIPLIISIFLRATPLDPPIAEDWARGNIYNNVQSQIANEVRAQYPHLPQANIDSIVSKNFNEFVKANKKEIEDRVKDVSAYFKSRLQKENGQTYLIAIDPYFWMRHAKNVLENGHPGDELRNIETDEVCEKQSDTCQPYDTYMWAPVGRPIPTDMFHAYFEAYLHKFISIFNPNQDLMSTAFITPILLASLCVIPAFFITRKIAGDFGGFVAALFIAIHPAFLTRTVGGFADTDAYNVLLPLFITWLFLEAFEAKDWKKASLLSGISGIIVAIYSISWGGWWYIFDFLLGSTIAFIIIYALIHREEIGKLLQKKPIKNSILVFTTFLVSTLIFTTMVANFGTFMNSINGPIGFLKFKEVGISTVWPNVFTTVAEQNTASLDGVISQIGTGQMYLFLIAIIGISLTLVKKNSKDKRDLFYFIGAAVWILIVIAMKPDLFALVLLISLPIAIKIVMAIYRKNDQIDFKLAIILIIWFTSTLFASTKGIRYILLLVPAYAIGFGIATGFAYEYVSRFIFKSLDINKTLAKAGVIVLLLLLMITPIRSARETAKMEIPSMNDAWYISLDKIRQESQEDAIINSWWDFGHWFKAIGDRAVTFDGTSQNTPMAHWIGHALLTNDEEDAIGVLRMLDCGSNNGFKELFKYVKDTAKTVEILHEIVVLDKEDAAEYLSDYVDEDKIEDILKWTHCEPPEDYFITSDDMIGKSGVWAHFGIWDFDRALVYNTLKHKNYSNNLEKSVDFLMDRFDYDEEEAKKLFYEVKGVTSSDQANHWIAPWPSYASGTIGCATDSNGTIICPIQPQGFKGTINMMIDLEKKSAVIKNPNGDIHPNSLVYPTENGVEKIVYENNTMGYGMTLIPNGDGWAYIMSITPMEDSIFTRLYYLDGHGLKKFKKFSDERSVTGGRIIVWKVDWDSEEMVKSDAFKTEEELVREAEELEASIAESEDTELIGTETEEIDEDTDIDEEPIGESIPEEELSTESESEETQSEENIPEPPMEDTTAESEE